MINSNQRRNFIKSSAGAGLYVAFETALETSFRVIRHVPYASALLALDEQRNKHAQKRVMLEGVEVPVVCEYCP
jgi:hypothetical protein